MAVDPLHLLLIEDNKIDVMDVKRALRKRSGESRLVVAADGQEALELLRGTSGPPLVPPYVVLMDLNVPRLDGLEFLRTLRADPALRRAVVFAWSTSSAPRDIDELYALNIAGYLLKGHDDGHMDRIVHMLSTWWRLVQFPRS